jgi:CheY-like chemotaxis protein
MGSTVTVTSESPATFGVHRGNVVCVPAGDADFAASVDAAIGAVHADQSNPAPTVEQRLRRTYPEASLVARDPMAGFDGEGVWYAMRDGRPRQVSLRRILVVDDDPTTADVIGAALEPSRFEVRSATDGADALALIADWPPNLVLLDLTMPRMGGEEFAQRYREMPPPRAPLVVVSVAHDAPVRALRIEARLVVPKPFDLGLLAHLVDTYA